MISANEYGRAPNTQFIVDEVERRLQYRVDEVQAQLDAMTDAKAIADKINERLLQRLADIEIEKALSKATEIEPPTA